MSINHKHVTSEVVVLKGVMNTWVGVVHIIRDNTRERHPFSANGTATARAVAQNILTREGINPSNVPIYWYRSGIAYRTHTKQILPELRELLLDVAHTRFQQKGHPLNKVEAEKLAKKQTRIRELERENYQKFYT